MLTRVEYIDRKESICVRELLCTAPHRHHDEVDDRWYTKKAL